jgi:acetyltransferase-like isoleucine patch superfamily enzyme
MRAIWVIRFYFYKLIGRTSGWKGYIGKPKFVKGLKNIYLGKNFRIFPDSRIESLGNGKIIFGDNCVIGHNLFITCSEKDIEIGSECIFSANVFFGTQKNDFLNISSDSNWFKENITEHSIKIGNKCFIGHGAVILPGTILGNKCVIGANAVVGGVFEDGSIVAPMKSKKINY